MSARRADAVLTGAVHALGVVAFLWPFFTGGGGGRAAAHAGDAPLVFTAFGALLVGVAVAEVRSGRLTTKHLAVLGVLAGLNAVLRLPGAFGGASLMFVLPIVCGAAFGARFGFLLGALSMAASALITGGVGPWLPFQMWALGWIGGGAAILRRAGTGTPAILAFAAYGWAAGLLFGALVNLWFWPFQQGAGPLSWVPGMGALEALARYGRFYLVTSWAWDTSRALANALLLAFLARPLLRLLTGFRARVEVAWVPDAPAPAMGTMGS